jgi:acetoin utilization protein AcuB
MAPQRTIESVMTPYPYSIEVDALAASAKALMTQFKIHRLPVTESGAVVGVVSEWGIKKAAEVGWDITPGGVARVRDVYTRDVYTVTPEEPLVNVLAVMAAKNVETVVIVRAGKLAGIFTSGDACKRYAELLKSQTY